MRTLSRLKGRVVHDIFDSDSDFDVFHDIHPGAFIDMGITKVGESKKFLLKICNKANHLMRFDVVPEDTG